MKILCVLFVFFGHASAFSLLPAPVTTALANYQSPFKIRERIKSIFRKEKDLHTIQEELNLKQEELDMAAWEERFDVVEIETIKLDGLVPGSEYHIAVAYGSEYTEHINVGKASGAGSIRDKVRILTTMDTCETDDELTIEVLRKRLIVDDEYLGKATFKMKELANPKKTFYLESPLHTYHNKDVPKVDLRLKIRNQEWNTAYKDVHVEQTKKGVAKFFTASAAALYIEKSSTANPKANEIEPPTKKADPNLKMETELDGVLEFPQQAEFVPVEPYKKFAMKAMNKLPFYDRLTPFRNREEAIREVAKLKILTEAFEGPWERPNSDEGLARLFFSSMGQWAIAKDELSGGYLVDTTFLKKYNHRPDRDYQHYGCKTYFDKDGKVTKIIDLDGITYFPNGTYIEKDGSQKKNTKYWEWAKLLSRSSGFAAMAIEHLASAHLTWGNYPGAALRMFLPPDHPIRKVFFIHFWKTANTVLRARGFLFDEFGLLLRATSWDYKTGLEVFFKDLLTDGFNFQHFPDFVKERGMEDCEFFAAGVDGMELYQSIVKYVHGYIDTVYASEAQLQADSAMRKCHEYLVKKMQFPSSEYTVENVKKMWGEIIFRVTGYHSSRTSCRNVVCTS